MSKAQRLIELRAELVELTRDLSREGFRSADLEDAIHSLRKGQQTVDDYDEMLRRAAADTGGFGRLVTQ